MDKLNILKYKIMKVLPAVYDDSLSYYEVLAKVVHKLNELIENETAQTDAISEIESNVESLSERFNELDSNVEGLNDRFVEFSDNINSTIETALKDYDGYNDGKVLGVVNGELKWIDNGGGGGGGTSDYDDLENKPEINGVELSGNKTASDLNLEKKIIKEQSNNPNESDFNIDINSINETPLLSAIIEGNMVKIKQYVIADSTSPYVVPSGHIFYSYINGIENIGVSTGEGLTADVNNNDLIYDLTVSKFTETETANITTFKNSWYKKLGFPFTNLADLTEGDGEHIYCVNAPCIKITGRNLFDGQINEVGEADVNWKSYNIIPVIPNSSYYIKSTNEIKITYMDIVGETIDTITTHNSIFTTPINCAKIDISSTLDFIPNDICINKSDVDFNGEYEEYYGSYVPYYKSTFILRRIGNIKDSFDIISGVYTQNIGQREYQAGDENNPDVVVDTGYNATYYVLDNPIISNFYNTNLKLREGYNTLWYCNDYSMSLTSLMVIKYYENFLYPNTEIPYYYSYSDLPEVGDTIPLDFIANALSKGCGIIIMGARIYYLTLANIEQDIALFTYYNTNTNPPYIENMVISNAQIIAIKNDQPIFKNIIEIPPNSPTTGSITITREFSRLLMNHPEMVQFNCYPYSDMVVFLTHQGLEGSTYPYYSATFIDNDNYIQVISLKVTSITNTQIQYSMITKLIM